MTARPILDSFEIPGLDQGTALSFTPDSRGALLMSVTGPDSWPHAGVELSSGWLLALAAWFAGESRPATHGDSAAQPLLCIVADEAAVVWSVHTWARLRCSAPFGPVQILVSPLHHSSGPLVFLSPGARQEAARNLRRMDTA